MNYVTCFTHKLSRLRFIPRKTTLKFWGIAILTSLLFVVSTQLEISPAQSQIINLPEAIQQQPTLDVTQVGNLDISTVRLDGKLLFRVATPTPEDTGNRNSKSPIERRVKTIEFHLSDIVQRGFDPNTLQVTPSKLSNQTIIIASDKDWGPRNVLNVTPYDVELDEPGTIDQIAERWSQIIEKALLQAQEQRQPNYQQQQIPFVLGTLAVMLIGSFGIKKIQDLRNYIRQTVEQRQQDLDTIESNTSTPIIPDISVDAASLPISQEKPRHRLARYFPKLSLEQQIGINLIVRRVLFAMQFVIWFGGIAIILQRFPQTNAFGAWLLRVPLAYIGIPIGAHILKLVLDTAIKSNTKLIVDRIREGGNGNVRLHARAKTIENVMGELTGYVAVLLGLLVFFYVIKALNIILIAIGAIAFLSQDVLKDFLQTYFILLEDQYALGDWIQIGEVKGQVETVSLRASQLRAKCGDLFTISHGSFTKVTNFSHGYSGIDLYIDVAYKTDLDQAIKLIEQVARQMQQDFLWEKYITNIIMKGVENFGDNSITIHLILNTEAGQQWDVAREYRRRLKPAFDQAGIDIPFPQRSIWFKNALTSTQEI
ncbi:mechanosensitive ion channel family protein [Xenococcus sp. PCC 7305]|uniref:mechanosensitive ion channel family protein n=1 Tax=Xenococcus sp. PCC 7305 TaxID=102125 RepID=UPI00130E9C47|nr:mechanosensitive ion channel domain-containing protein [Xenococcus sp. PCC 7305]